MFILFIISLFLFLGFAAVVQMTANKSYLKQMDKLIELFEAAKFSSIEEKEYAKRELKKKLIKLKSKILVQAKATEEASDKLNNI